MKKILVILVMILITSPLYISACSPAWPDSGVIVEIDGCDYKKEVNSELTFDVLVKKEEIPVEMLRGSVHHDFLDYMGFDAVEDILYHDYLDLDNEWVSLSAFYDWNHNRPYNSSCGASFDYNDNVRIYETFTKVKVVVFDETGTMLNESTAYNTSIVLERDNRDDTDNQRVMYNKENNLFYLQSYTIDWESFDNACDNIYINMFAVMIALGLLAIYILYSLVIEPIKLKLNEIDKKHRLIGIGLSILTVLILFFGLYNMAMHYLSLVMAVITAGYKIYIIRHFKKRFIPVLVIFNVLMVIIIGFAVFAFSLFT